jgi:hypothetical protein
MTPAPLTLILKYGHRGPGKPGPAAHHPAPGFALAALGTPRLGLITAIGRGVDRTGQTDPTRSSRRPRSERVYRPGSARLSDVVDKEGTSVRSLFLVSILVLGFATTVPQADAADVRMFIRHEVTDYATWRKAYNAFDATRRKLGVTGQAVYQSLDNANDVTVTHDFKTADQAKAFASSPDLKTTMEKAGVKGSPQIWFTTSAAK